MIPYEPTIVVVDPDADRATALSTELDRHGYHVLRRSAGIDALKCVCECRPDLVLSEDELMDLDVPELLHSIHEASPTTRVLVVARHEKPIGLAGEEVLAIGESSGQGGDAIALAVDRLLDR